MCFPVTIDWRDRRDIVHDIKNISKDLGLEVLIHHNEEWNIFSIWTPDGNHIERLFNERQIDYMVYQSQLGDIKV